jgi:excisionase family DNA binding protein
VSTENATVSGLPVQAVERYVTRQELARIMGVSVGTIDNMVREGMPSTTWGRRTRRFRASTAIAWAQERRVA